MAAYETALQLNIRGIRVQGLLLIDSPNPNNHVPLSEELIESVLNLEARSTSSEIARLMKAQFAMNAHMLGKYDPRATGGTCPPIVLLRSRDGYNPSGVPHVPQWLADRTNITLATAGWETLSGAPLKVIDIPGHHFQPFHPSKVRALANCIVLHAYAFFRSAMFPEVWLMLVNTWSAHSDRRLYIIYTLFIYSL